MKSEPEVFSIDHLQKNQKTLWEGVRNYQARNFMQKEMHPGDQVLFYHSNAKPSGVSGLAEVSKEATPDPTQFDPQSEYYDSKATLEKPIWYCVELSFVSKFKKFVSLEVLKSHKELQKMLVVKKGQRLSIQPVEKLHFKIIQSLGRKGSAV